MASLSSILLLLRGIGPASLAGIAATSRIKKRLDQAYLDSPVGEPQIPGFLIGYAQISGSFQLQFTYAVLQLKFLAPDLLRFSWQPNNLPPNGSPHYAIVKADWPPVQIEILETSAGIQLTSSAIQAAISRDGAVQIRDNQDRLLRYELPPSFQIIQPNSLHPAQSRCTSQAMLEPGEFLAGLGEHSGPVGLRQRNFSLWNTDPGGAHGPHSDPLYMPLPVYLSLRTTGSSLIFFENSSRARFEFDTPTSPSKALAAFESGDLCWYLFAGPPARALERFSELTGRPALPPRWSLGYHQSRWGYKTAEDIRQVVTGFAEHGFPLDVIHLDIDYMDGFRVFTVDDQRFPDLATLSAELHAKSIRLVTIIDPGVKQDQNYPIYQQGLSGRHFAQLPGNKPLRAMVWPGKCAFPDFTNPTTRQWWGDCYQFLLDSGVDGIWHDMNEPAAFSASGELTLPLAAQHDLDGGGGDHLQAHNLYGMQMNRAGWEGLDRLRPERRPWILSRSGWVGNARYAWNWTADVETSWENLQQTIATLLGMGISGIPFTGSDIGGFTADPSPELYLRWFQMAAFHTLMRTHSAVGAAPRHPWTFGEPYTTFLSETLRLRKRLLPYLYTQAWIASQTGAPLVRPLFWIEPDNPILWPVDDAFLFGEALLAAPVCKAGISARSVTLPSGTWFDYWTDEILVGPGTLQRPVSLEYIPLLVRDMTMLPTVEEDRLTLHCYLDQLNALHTPRLVGQLYSDAGDGYGSSRLDRFLLAPHDRGLALTWEAQGEYPFPYSSYKLVFHGKQPAAWQTPTITPPLTQLGSPAPSSAQVLYIFEV